MGRPRPRVFVVRNRTSSLTAPWDHADIAAALFLTPMYAQAAKPKSGGKGKAKPKAAVALATGDLVWVRDMHGQWHEGIVAGPCEYQDTASCRQDGEPVTDAECYCIVHENDHDAPFRCRFVKFPGISAAEVLPNAANIKKFQLDSEALSQESLFRAIRLQCEEVHLSIVMTAFGIDPRTSLRLQCR